VIADDHSNLEPRSFNVKTTITVGLLSIMASGIVVAEEPELDLDKDQKIRLACIQVVVGTNPMTGVSSNQLEWKPKASKLIRDQVEWCAKFVKDGSMEFKG